MDEPTTSTRRTERRNALGHHRGGRHGQSRSKQGPTRRDYTLCRGGTWSTTGATRFAAF